MRRKDKRADAKQGEHGALKPEVVAEIEAAGPGNEAVALARWFHKRQAKLPRQRFAKGRVDSDI